MPMLKTKNYKVTEMRQNSDGSYHLGAQMESDVTPGLYAGQPFTYLSLTKDEFDAFTAANGGTPLAFGQVLVAPFGTA